ncbi:MAG: ATPase, T2SS/T4P/T4SS family [Promethearchaeota archaeon]
MFYQNEVNCDYKVEENFDPIFEKEHKTLIIRCENCTFFSKHRKPNLSNPQCFANIIKLFINNKNLTNTVIETTNNVLQLTHRQIILLTDYTNQLIQNPYLKKLTFQAGYECAKENECKNEQHFFFDHILGNKFNNGLLISNPIMAYIEINQELNINEKLPIKKKECKNCYAHFIQLLSNLSLLLNNTKIIKDYLALDRKNRPFSEIYNLIFGDCDINTIQNSFRLLSVEDKEKICASYKKGPYEIKIVQNLETKKYIYKISPITNDPHLQKIFNEVIQKVDSKPKEYFDSTSLLKLNFLLQHEKRLTMHLLRRNYENLSVEIANDLAELIVYELINLNPIITFLIDDEIEEIFLDTPSSYIYLDHRQFGRCRTEVSLTPMEIESFKTRIRMEAEQRLDEIQPFLKSEIITDKFHIRVSIQIYPLAVEKFSLNIRKLHKKILTLLDLIKNKTLSIDAAAYLLFNFIHGRCILVIGEPYSGKTTLINSLDMIGNEDWRKIYIEDVIESIDQSTQGAHQIRFHVDPNVEHPENYATKSFQVKESLHRTPDAIFIGELIHPKSVESFFFLLKVGLRRCLATAHGESPELMVERFIYDDKIPLPLIGNLDIIVQMSRFKKSGQIIRRVTRITEVQKETQFSFNQSTDPLRGSSNLSFEDIFLRNSDTDQLEKTFESFNKLYKKSNIINKIKLLRGESISNESFILEINNIKNILDELIKRPESNMGEIIKSFHTFWQEMEIKS